MGLRIEKVAVAMRKIWSIKFFLSFAEKRVCHEVAKTRSRKMRGIFLCAFVAKFSFRLRRKILKTWASILNFTDYLQKKANC